MKKKKKYLDLDDIGFVGTQKKMSPAKRKEMEGKTGEWIRAHRKANGLDKKEKLS